MQPMMGSIGGRGLGRCCSSVPLSSTCRVTRDPRTQATSVAPCPIQPSDSSKPLILPRVALLSAPLGTHVPSSSGTPPPPPAAGSGAPPIKVLLPSINLPSPRRACQELRVSQGHHTCHPAVAGFFPLSGRWVSCYIFLLPGLQKGAQQQVVGNRLGSQGLAEVATVLSWSCLTQEPVLGQECQPCAVEILNRGWGGGATHCGCLAACSAKRPSLPWLGPRVSHPQNGSQNDPLREAAEMLRNAWHSGKTPGKLATPPCLSSGAHCQARGAEGREQKELPNSDSLSLRLG